MSQQYTYAPSAFTTSGGVVNPDGLSYSIEQDETITTTLEAITNPGGGADVTFTFEDVLSSGEETALDTIVANHTGEAPTYPETDFRYWDAEPDFTDTRTSKAYKATPMRAMIAERELFNNSDSPIFLADHTPILGSSGWAEDHATRIDNMDTIHAKLGWHNQQVEAARYTKPKDLLIYYGWPNSFNSAVNSWTNEKVARDMSKYSLIVLGDGLQTIYDDGTHDGGDSQSTLTDSTKSWTTNEWVGDWINNITKGTSAQITANTATTITAASMTWDDDDVYRIAYHQDYVNLVKILPRIKLYNNSAKIFGYVSVNQSLANFQGKVDDWDLLEIHGIFMDEAGYDYGTTTTNSRSAFNTKVDYVHGKTYSSLAFANAWNTDHILGTTNDPSYPNSTWNSSSDESNLNTNDWILLESLSVNTTAYSGNNGYASEADWRTRVNKVITLRATYGVNFAAAGIINNDNASGDDLFNFSFIAALMASLEAHGTSDTSYASSSSAVDFWTRPDVTKMGTVWTLNASIVESTDDGDVLYRFSEFARMSIDFSTGAQTSSITKW